MEEWYLDKYYLLVRRIPGLSLSIDDYWKTPTSTINQLYNNEMEVIQKEEEEQRKLDKGHNTKRSDHKEDSQSAIEFDESLYQEFDPETGEKF